MDSSRQRRRWLRTAIAAASLAVCACGHGPDSPHGDGPDPGGGTVNLAYRA